jgi:amicyanin
MTRIRRTAMAASGGVLAIVLAGCGGSSSASNTGSGSSSSVQSGTANVEIVNYSFKPSSLTVTAGTKVTYTMEDAGTVHTATGTGNSAFINSPMLKKGQSYTVTFSKAGTYSYICSVHPYMKGTVVVK